VQISEFLAQIRQLAGQIQTALASQVLIDQATGILMSRERCMLSKAFARLQTMSRVQHLELPVIARRLLDEADARTRASREPDDSTPYYQRQDHDRRTDS
jgi:AmiR/NasT family two-component response regulator